MFLVQIKNIFVEKNFLCLIFLIPHQFFHLYKTFDLNTWQNELNLQKQTKFTQNLRYHVHYKTILRRVDEMANMKKENSKIWSEEAIIP